MPAYASWILYFSGFSFLIYGISCLFSRHMRDEFQRFGLPRYRVLVGWLEVVGGAAQLVHAFVPYVGTIATAGLCALMTLGLVTRIKVGDSLAASLPAWAYLAVNAIALWLILTPP